MLPTVDAAIVSTQQQAPVWARAETFSVKPESGAFGFQDAKGKRHSADSLNDLTTLVKKSKHSVELVWTPKHARMLTPDELPALRPILSQRREEWARGGIADGKRFSLIMGIGLLWAVYAAYANSGGQLSVLGNTPTVAMAAIMLLMFGLVPWYEGWKELRNAKSQGEEYWQKEVEEARFDAWISQQASPWTFALLAMLLLTGIAQWYVAGGVEWGKTSVEKVGLLKDTVQGRDPLWRYLTAPMVHGNLVHWLMNFAALRYLAKRVESLARWPQMLIVFSIAAFVGGMATVKFAPSVASVGASGGILGLLGFLLVFETLHRKLVPRTTRKRLLAGLVSVALMGVLGFSFIDNAAHLGGLVAGMVYAAIVFPSSNSVVRPVVLVQDKVAGSVAAVILLGTTLLSILRLLG